MRLFITGDSHLGALRRRLLTPDRPAPAAGQPGIVLEALGRGQRMTERFFDPQQDHVEIIDPDFRQRVRRVPPDDPTIDAVGICAPLNTARVWRHPDFARYHPLATGGGIPISNALLKAVVDRDVRPALDFVAAVQRHRPVFVIDAPWPFARHPAVAQAGAEIVQWIHRFYRDQVKVELDRMRVPVIECPPACVDSQGFTLERYRSENRRDLYHANAAWGQVMLDLIAQRYHD